MTYFSGKQDLKQGQIGNILASFDKFSSTTKTRNFPGNWDFTTHNILAIGDDPASFDEFFSGHKTLYLTLSKYQGTTCKMKIIVISKVEKLVYDDFAKDLINFVPN